MVIEYKWGRIFKALIIDPDCELEFIDGSYVKAHQHSAGAARSLSDLKHLEGEFVKIALN